MRTRKILRKLQEFKKGILYFTFASKPTKVFFDHLPKCGGSSLYRYLEAHYPKSKTFTIDWKNPPASIEQFKALPRHVRYGYELVKGHKAQELLDYVHPECIKVTVLREPVDRIVSHYYYVKRRPTHYLHSKILESDMTLEEYALSNLNGELRNWYTTHFSGLTLADAEQFREEAVARAVDSVMEQYDLVGFLDDFESFVTRLRNLTGLKHKYTNKKVNVTVDRPAFDTIEPATIEKIKEINSLDILFYGKIKEQFG